MYLYNRYKYNCFNNTIYVGDFMIDMIIPIYNTPIEDIKRCFASIEASTYSNYHCIVVDDGSGEKVSDFLDNYAFVHPAFEIIHQENRGVSAARNTGLKACTGEYLTFVDADDEISPNFLEESLKLLEENDLDMVVGEIVGDKVTRVRNSKDGLWIYEGNDLEKYMDKVISSKTGEDNSELLDTTTGRIYTKLYRRSCIGEVHFTESVRISEDTLFLIDLGKNLKRVGVVPNIWYTYYQNTYSIVHQKMNDKKFMEILAFLDEIKERIPGASKRLQEAFYKRLKKTKESYWEELNPKQKKVMKEICEK